MFGRQVLVRDHKGIEKTSDFFVEEITIISYVRFIRF